MEDLQSALGLHWDARADRAQGIDRPRWPQTACPPAASAGRFARTIRVRPLGFLRVVGALFLVLGLGVEIYGEWDFAVGRSQARTLDHEKSLRDYRERMDDIDDIVEGGRGRSESLRELKRQGYAAGVRHAADTADRTLSLMRLLAVLLALSGLVMMVVGFGVVRESVG